jgi:hypothetical protein
MKLTTLLPLNEKFGSSVLQRIFSNFSGWEVKSMMKALPRQGIDLNKIQDSDIKKINKSPKQLYGKKGLYLIIASQDFDFKESGQWGWKNSIKKGQLIGMMYNGKVAYITSNGLGRPSRTGGSKAGMDMRGARSVAAMSEMPYVTFHVDYQRTALDVQDKVGTRQDQKKGALALKDASKIKKDNLARYKKILQANANNKGKIDELVGKTLKKVNSDIEAAIKAQELDQYANLKMGDTGYDVSQAGSQIRQLLETYARYVRDQKEAEKEKEGGYGNYRQQSSNSYALEIKQKAAKLAKGDYSNF